MHHGSDSALLDFEYTRAREDKTFNELLYEWMGRAPWVAISFAAHLIVFLVLTLIPWSLLHIEDEREVAMSIEPAAPEIVEEPPPEEPPEVEDVAVTEEPALVDALEEDLDAPETDLIEETVGTADLLNDATSPFNSTDLNAVLGIGPGAGKYGGRFGGGPGGRGRGGSGTEKRVRAALTWLAKHQSPDGYWDCDDFMNNCAIGRSECDGAGESPHDVGVTGLALLAFLGNGHTTRRPGPFQENVTRGIRWLVSIQDFDTGQLGDKIGHSYLYDHSIAALALCEAYYFSKSPVLRAPAQKAIQFCSAARNPYGAWGYHHPPRGANDTSVTGWMVMAMTSARDAGLQTDPAAFRDALQWFDEATDPATGRVGYRETGSLSSRIEGVNSHFPPEAGEGMTAVALLCRFFLGQEPQEEKVMKQHADLLRSKLPEWDDDGLRNDMYYWYYGSYAMFQMGGSHWRAWQKAMEKAVADSQRGDGDFAGSWDPNGPWGHSGGRVYSTALMALCLQAYYRYTRVLGGR